MGLKCVYCVFVQRIHHSNEWVQFSFSNHFVSILHFSSRVSLYFVFFFVLFICCCFTSTLDNHHKIVLDVPNWAAPLQLPATHLSRFCSFFSFSACQSVNLCGSMRLTIRNIRSFNLTCLSFKYICYFFDIVKCAISADINIKWKDCSKIINKNAWIKYKVKSIQLNNWISITRIRIAYYQQ